MPARKQEEALLVPTVEISSMKHSTLAIWLISALSSQNSPGQIWDKRALILKKGWTDLWQIQNGEVFSQKLVLHTWLRRIRIIIPFLLIAQVIFLSLLIGPFRFELAWTLHEDFKELISHVWNSSCGSNMQNVNHLTQCLKNWNRNHFGIIFQKKRRFLP